MPNVMWPEECCFCPVCLSVRPETLLTRYLAEYLTHFHPTYVNDTLWDRRTLHSLGPEGHGGMKYAGNGTFWAC